MVMIIMMYNLGIAERILKMCYFLLTWSAIMNEHFGYGFKTESSASIESNVNNIKNRIFGHKNLPIRIEDFIKLHINDILGNMNLIKSEKYGKDDATDELRKKSPR